MKIITISGPLVRRSSKVLRRVHRVLGSSERSASTKSKGFCVWRTRSADLFIIFSVLRLASAIASEDPGPSTEGAAWWLSSG